jgi:hypothetical protein
MKKRSRLTGVASAYLLHDRRAQSNYHGLAYGMRIACQKRHPLSRSQEQNVFSLEPSIAQSEKEIELACS